MLWVPWTYCWNRIHVFGRWGYLSSVKCTFGVRHTFSSDVVYCGPGIKRSTTPHVITVRKSVRTKILSCVYEFHLHFRRYFNSFYFYSKLKVLKLHNQQMFKSITTFSYVCALIMNSVYFNHIYYHRVVTIQFCWCYL